MIIVMTRTILTRMTMINAMISLQALSIVRTYFYLARRMEPHCAQPKVYDLSLSKDRRKANETFSHRATVMVSKSRAKAGKCSLQALLDLSNPCSSRQVLIIERPLRHSNKICRMSNNTTTPVGSRAPTHRLNKRKCLNVDYQSKNVSWASIRMIFSNQDRCRCEAMELSGEVSMIRSNDLSSNME